MWRRAKARACQEGRVGVELSADGCALAHVVEDGEAVRLGGLDAAPGVQGEAATAWLAERVTALRLVGARCTAVLAPARYSLHRVEAPDVEPEERAAALRWLVRDLIDFPIEEAVVDHVEIPELRAHAGRSQLHVVAARTSAVRELALAVEGAGLVLERVDVGELALRNLCERHPEQERGVALLRIGARGGSLLVTQAGSLMLSRAIELGGVSLHEARAIALPGEEQDPASELLDAAVLEVQRTLDYFESQIGGSPVAALLLAPSADPVDGLEGHLEKQLAVPVQRLELGSWLAAEQPPEPELAGRCLCALGAALRSEDAS